MNCQEAKELLSDYLDERLADHRLSSFERHLADCDACRKEVEALRRTISLLGSLDPVEPSADFLSRIRDKIEKRRIGNRIWTWLFQPLRVKVPLEATALILVGVTALYLYRNPPDVSQQLPRSAALEKVGPLEEKSPERAAKEADSSEKSYRMAEREQGTRMGKTETAPKGTSVEMPEETVASARQSQLFEMVVRDVADYEKKVRALLVNVDGRVLAEKHISGHGLVLTIEVPQSRQDQFIVGLKEDAQTGENASILNQEFFRSSGDDRQAADRIGEGMKTKAARSPGSRVRRDEPTVILQVRILPEQ